MPEQVALFLGELLAKKRGMVIVGLRLVDKTEKENNADDLKDPQ